MVFNRNIDVEGDLHLNIEVGPNDADGGLQTAAYRSSRSDSITFGYTVVPGDLNNDGITLLGSIGG